MGHFLATVRHRIAASLPYFLPLPITPIGTLGAVIGMDGLRANRKQIFDIGIAAPGGTGCRHSHLVGRCRPTRPDSGRLRSVPARHATHYSLDGPGDRRAWIRSGSHYLAKATQPSAHGRLGGIARHRSEYATGQPTRWRSHHLHLFGRKSRWIARMFILVSVGYMVMFNTLQPLLMIGLILLIGVDHPPTSDDSVPLGRIRTILGFAAVDSHPVFSAEVDFDQRITIRLKLDARQSSHPRRRSYVRLMPDARQDV